MEKGKQIEREGGGKFPDVRSSENWMGSDFAKWQPAGIQESEYLICHRHCYWSILYIRNCSRNSSIDLDLDLLILLYLTSLGFVIDLERNKVTLKHIFFFLKTTCGSVEHVWPNFGDSDLVHC